MGIASQLLAAALAIGLVFGMLGAFGDYFIKVGLSFVTTLVTAVLTLFVTVYLVLAHLELGIEHLLRREREADQPTEENLEDEVDRIMAEREARRRGGQQP